MNIEKITIINSDISGLEIFLYIKEDQQDNDIFIGKNNSDFHIYGIKHFREIKTDEKLNLIQVLLK